MAQDTLVYIGPTIPGNQLRQYDMFVEGIPEHLDIVFVKYPAIKALFISIDRLPGHQKELKDTSSALSQVYANVLRWTRAQVSKAPVQVKRSR